VVGGSNAADRAIDNRHASSGRRALDRRAAEQSARRSGHRDPTDVSAGSQWGFRTRRRQQLAQPSAFPCAAGQRRMASCLRERGAGAACRGSIFTAFRWTRPEGSPRARSPAAVLTTAPLACHSLNASVSQQVVLGHPDETQAESAKNAASDLRSIHMRNGVAALRRHGVTCPPDLPW
jgi:hypothetical protein